MNIHKKGLPHQQLIVHKPNEQALEIININYAPCYNNY